MSSAIEVLQPLPPPLLEQGAAKYSSSTIGCSGCTAVIRHCPCCGEALIILNDDPQCAELSATRRKRPRAPIRPAAKAMDLPPQPPSLAAAVALENFLTRASDDDQQLLSAAGTSSSPRSLALQWLQHHASSS